MTPAASTVGLMQNVSVVVTMSEAVRGVTTSNLSPSCGSVTAVSGDNSTTLTFTVDVDGGGGAACSDGDTLTASFSTSGLTDAAGNSATGSESKAYTVDGLPLELTGGTSAVVGANLQITLIFNSAPSMVSGETFVDGDFNIAQGAGDCLPDKTIGFGTNISGSTLVVTMDRGTCIAGGSFEIEFTNPTAQDKIHDGRDNVGADFTAVPGFEQSGGLQLFGIDP